MNPQIRHAQRACESAKARQAVVVFIDEVGQYAVASYGETKAECTAVKPLCNAIGDAIDEGVLPMPGSNGGDVGGRLAVELVVDRPFFYALVDQATGVVVVAGRYTG